MTRNSKGPTWTSPLFNYTTFAFIREICTKRRRRRRRTNDRRVNFPTISDQISIVEDANERQPRWFASSSCTVTIIKFLFCSRASFLSAARTSRVYTFDARGLFSRVITRQVCLPRRLRVARPESFTRPRICLSARVIGDAVCNAVPCRAAIYISTCRRLWKKKEKGKKRTRQKLVEALISQNFRR